MDFANDGGPLLLVPLSPAPLWEGGEIPSGGRIVKADSRTVQDVATDYDRACDVRGGAALLPAGSGWVIAVSGEVAAASWIRLSSDSTSFAFVGVDAWEDPSSDTTIRAKYELLSKGEWANLARAVPIEGGMELMHAAGIPGGEDRIEFSDARDEEPAVIGDSIVFPCPKGSYSIEFLEHVQRRTGNIPGEYAVLIQFTKQG